MSENEKKYEGLEIARETSKARLNDLDEALSALKNQKRMNESSTKAVTQYREMYEQQKSINDALRIDKGVLTAERDSWRTRAEKLERQCTDLLNQIKELTIEVKD